MPLAEGDGVGPRGTGEIVDVAFAGEMVRRRGEAAVGALAERRLRGMEDDALMRDLVGRADAGRARVVVVHLPRGDGAVLGETTGHVDHARGPEVGPGELLFAG